MCFIHDMNCACVVLCHNCPKNLGHFLQVPRRFYIFSFFCSSSNAPINVNTVGGGGGRPAGHGEGI